MNRTPIYPIGTADFELIRRKGMVYVDKTEYIWEMANMPAPIFLSRPRRFGKSLLADTMACYFRGRKDLFENLKISKHEKEWTAYPVLRFDLSRAKEGTTIDTVLEGLYRQLDEYERLWGVAERSLTLGERLVSIIKSATAKTSLPVVILIDEYDAPLNNNIDRDDDFLAAIRSEMRSFLSPIKSCAGDIRFAFLTGITRYSQLGIFSELNNIKNISMDPLFAGVCGITKEELDTVLRGDVELMARKLKLSVEETYAKLEYQYDGYHTCECSPDIFSPFSLMNAFRDGELNNYWFGSATPTMLVKYMKKKGTTFDISELDGKTVSRERFDIPIEMADDAIALLYQAGYITIKGYDPDDKAYTIGIPNNDVRLGLSKSLLPIVTHYSTGRNDDFIFDFKRAIRSDNLATARDLLHAYLAGIPCDVLHDKGEHTYHAIFYTLFSLLGCQPKIENGMARGYSDMIFRTPTTIYCMEFKVDKSAETAISQIISKGYLEPYATSGKRLVMIGVNFSTDQRNITEWIEREFHAFYR